MSCVFCDSFFHVSQNCDIYIYDEERENAARKKNRCGYCFTKWNSTKCCFDCVLHEKCYICFSRAHHIAFCPERNTVPKLHCPKIDRILMIRFMQMLDIKEQMFLTFSSPVVFKTCQPKAFQITKTGKDVRSMSETSSCYSYQKSLY